MAVSKKGSYISLELEWLERKISEMQEAIDSYDLAHLEDRMDLKPTKNGGVVQTCVASKEDQMKAVAFIMEKLPKMFQALDELRAKEDQIIVARGGADVPHRMRKNGS